jgi:hypothetical protein
MKEVILFYEWLGNTYTTYTKDIHKQGNFTVTKRKISRKWLKEKGSDEIRQTLITSLNFFTF